MSSNQKISTMGEKIQECRKINKLSQEELGRRVGVKRAAIQKYENGTVTNIPLETIEKMADIFEINPAHLVGWGDQHVNILSTESKVIKGVQFFYGKDVVDILYLVSQLNQRGQRRIVQYAKELQPVYSK